MNRFLSLVLVLALMLPQQVLAYSDPFEEMFQQAFEEGQLPEVIYIESDGTVSDAAAMFREADSAVFGPQPASKPLTVAVPKPEPVPVIVEPEPEPEPAPVVLREPEDIQAVGDRLKLENFIMNLENSREVSFKLVNSARHAVGPLLVKHKFFDDSTSNLRIIAQEMNWIEARDEVEIFLTIPETAVGNIDVYLEVAGRIYENKIGAFIYPGKTPTYINPDTISFETGEPLTQVMESQEKEQRQQSNDLANRVYHLDGSLLDQARRIVKEQSLTYLAADHEEAIDKATNVFEMFDIVGDADGQYYPEGVSGLEQATLSGTARLKDIQGYDHFVFPNFSSRSMTAFMDFMELIRQRGSKGIILDLRGNHTGSNSQAIDTLEPFLEASDIIMYIKSRKGRQGLEAYNNALVKDIDMMILVDRNTGKAAEVLAAGLKEYGHGQLIGESTMGETTLYNYSTLTDDSLIVLTYANWYTGKYGRDLSGEGLSVDYDDVDDPATPDDESVMKAIQLFDLRQQQP